MHRRRSRERREAKPRAHAPAAAPAGKRRAREGAAIPDALRLSKVGPPRPRNRDDAPGSMTVLVTGFECFGGETVNPSWEACKRLPHEISEDVEAKRANIHGVPTGIVYIAGREIGRIEGGRWDSPETALRDLLAEGAKGGR